MKITDRIALAYNAFNGGPNKKEINNAAIKLASQIKREHSLYRKEIADWKKARSLALDAEEPRRYLLQYLYDDVMNDAFIYGKWENRKLRISNRKIQVLHDGNVDQDKTKLINTLWFNKFIKHYIDSRAYGYNLLYVKKLDEDGHIKELSHFPRTNIIPERCELIKNVYDRVGDRFDEPPYSDWMMFFGDSDDLGLLDKAAPLWIFKKHSWQNWDEFEEMFGIPIRIAKLASDDPRVQSEVKKWLKSLGSASYGLFPQGTEIEVHESKTTDAFNVFNEKRKAANEELAILIDGQFESSNNSGSRAKAESVIEATQHEITEDDATMTLFAINEVLIPFLIKRGYPFTDLDEVFWNDNKEKDPKERLKIFEGVKRLGYAVKKDQIESELDVEIDELPPEPPKPIPGNNNPANFNLPHNHLGCGAHLDTYRIINLDVNDDLSADEMALLRKLWKDRENINWSYKEFTKNHGDLLNAIRTGYGEIDYDFESVDHGTMEAFQNNIHRFGTDKTQKQIYDLNQIIKDADVDSFEKFFARAKKVFPNYKRRWAQTEYNQAFATAQAASRYRDYMANIDIAPYWQYKTVNDDRVRPAHAALHNKVFRKDDSASWQFIPPNGYECRCDDVELIDWDGEISNLEDAIGADPDGWDKMIASGHNINWGDAKQAFTATQSYLSGLAIGPIDYSEFDYRVFGLNSVSRLLKPDLIGKGKLRFNAYTDGSGFAKFNTAEDLPAWLSPEIAAVISANIRHRLPDVLRSPDELFIYNQGSNTVKSYFKHYKDGSLNALVTVSPNELAKVTAFVKLNQPDQWRKGLLIHTPQVKTERQLRLYNSYDANYRKEFFNTKNGGFIVTHVKHGVNELRENKTIAKLLANKGHGVALLENINTSKSADAQWNGIPWEFKTMKGAKNIEKRLKKHFVEGSSQAANILVYINQRYSLRSVELAIKSAVTGGDDKGRIKHLALLFPDGSLVKFSRKQVETGEYKTLLKQK